MISLKALGLCVNLRVHFPELPYAVMFPSSAVATALLEDGIRMCQAVEEMSVRGLQRLHQSLILVSTILL